MAIQVQVLDLARSQHAVSIDKRPDKCPLCHHAIHVHDQFIGAIDELKSNLQIGHRCPNDKCRALFIAYYRVSFSNRSVFEYSYSRPHKHVPRKFSDTISSISKEFCEIYNQALESEAQGLNKICGVGYRKALEFLLKDYLITLHPDKEEAIKKSLLGKCIAEYVSSENIKSVAKRAVWLGNDETHYVRVWADKDLADLKKLIDLTAHWIDMETLTKSIVTDMPE